MAKKRVHEIAKELGLPNKEVIEKLRKLGFDVSSHSNSLEEVDANAAISRIRGITDAPQAVETKPPMGAGVVRRRRKVSKGATQVVTETRIVPGTESRDEEVLRTTERAAPEVDPIEKSAPVPLKPDGADSEELVEAGPTETAEAGVSEASEDKQQIETVAGQTGETETQRPAAVDAEGAITLEKPEPDSIEKRHAEDPVAREDDAEGSEELVSKGHETADEELSAGMVADEAGAETEASVKLSEDTVTGEDIPVGETVESIDEKPAKTDEEKIDSKSGKDEDSSEKTNGMEPTARKKAARPPELLEPTSTQAVVLRRAAINIKPKVVPPASRNTEQAPGGEKRIGPIKEYQVVTDAQGRERELVDVSKDKAGKKKSGTPSRKAKETYTKTELLSLARERAFVPLRGRKKRATKKGKKTELTQAAAHKRIVKIEESIQVSDLAKQMGVKLVEVIRKLMQLGSPATANQFLDIDTAALVAQEFDYDVKKTGVDLEDILACGCSGDKDEHESEPRPPVVTVMGHVDHGKTSLLDYIRSTRVASGEAGGITQHIGAYSVKVGDGVMTFLDTPGHEAFTAMRARGAQVTDLVVLVVAADDSIMPQTVEAINHAKASNVPIVVAVNKCDLPQANPERVRQGLTEHEMVPEEWGGDTIVIDVSAKTGNGIDKLLEMVMLQAEMLDLKAPVDVPATGIVVESKVEKGRGAVATVLVKEGTLRRGDVVFTGLNSGRIRAMLDYKGKTLKEATPSMPVEIQGLDGVPRAGDKFFVVNDEKAARCLAERNIAKDKAREIAGSGPKRASLEELFLQMKEGEQKDLILVVKADVQGSVEAVIGALEKLSGPKVKISFLHTGIGDISESDVMLSCASNAVIIGFNTRADAKARRIAEHEGVQIRTYKVIYDAVNDVKDAMEGLLDPIRKENDIGKAEVRDIFRITGKGTIAGCAVTSGKVQRGAFVRVLREGEKVFEGRVDGLKRFKDDVKEVSSGYECGVSISGFNDLLQGDILEIFEVEEIRPTL